MADPNNIPQESQQLTEDLNSTDEDTKNKASGDMAKTNFDAEYEEAQKNSGGSGTQSSDSNPVSRKVSAEGTAGSGSSTGKAGRSKEAGKIDDIDSPGDSDPDDYRNMAREVTKGKGEA
ncbi:MAG: hypothetical protein WA947_05785 [Phormidesmis sp.]